MIHEKNPGAIRKASEEVQERLEEELIQDGKWIRYNEKGERIPTLNQPSDLQNNNTVFVRTKKFRLAA